MHNGGRTLTAVDTSSAPSQENWVMWLVLLSVKWAVHLIVVLGILIRIFVYGEPVTRPQTDAAVLFWRHRNQADIDLSRVCIVCTKYLPADHSRCKCTKFNMIASLCRTEQCQTFISVNHPPALV